MATSPFVPGRLPVAIEDHPFQIEPSGFRRETVPVLRQQADVSSEPGEMSLNPQGLWRRSQESWHHGAGQDFLDGRQDQEAPDPHRFRNSKGVDVWTRGQMSLLHPTIKSLSSANSNLHLAVGHYPGTGLPYLFVSDGTEVHFNTMPFGSLNTLALQAGTGWTPTNATLAASASNLGMMRVTATAAAVVTVASPTGLSGVPVEAGRQYSYVMSSKWAGGGGGGKIPTVTINWYDAAGALISSNSSAGAGTDDPSRVAGSMATAPATAAFASLSLTWAGAWIIGELHDVMGNIGPKDAIGTPAGPDIWSSVDINAGQAAQQVQSLATDGTNIWAALGTSGLHRNAVGFVSSTADQPAAPGSGQISLVGYANGFLLAAGSAGVSSSRQNTLWLVNDPLGTPSLTVIKTHPNTNFQWVGIAPGRSCVYAYGNCGISGEIYKITLDPNTGTLSSAASFASYLPEGETIHALTFYAGGIIMGTGRGLRLGQADGAGNIDYGPLIDTEWPVRCLEPQDRFCWFGWTKYDSTNSGLGRVDLGYFTGTLTPAWASDLMTADSSSGDVMSCVTFSPYGYSGQQRPPIRFFTVAGEGVYAEDAYSRVPTGNLYTGTFRYATSEPKSMRAVDVRHHALPAGGEVIVNMLRDDNPSTNLLLGVSTVTDSYGITLPAGDSAGEAFEFRYELIRPDPSGTDFTRTPELTRWTGKALPQPSTIDEIFTIPIIMAREVVDSNDANYPMDVDAEVTYLKGLERSRTLVNLQLGDEQHTVYIAASEYQGKNWSPGRDFLEGLYVIQAQTVRG